MCWRKIISRICIIPSAIAVSYICFAGALDSSSHALNKYLNMADEVTALDMTTIQKVYKKATNNEVAKLSVLSDYDPTGEIGFCFGRAMTSHLYAKKTNLAATSIKKLFIVGDLRADPKSEYPEWRFHVTTIVKGVDGNWYAIDPIMYKGGDYTPLTVPQWIEAVRNGWDTWQQYQNPPLPTHQAKLYVTAANAVLPDITTLVVPEPYFGERLIELTFDPVAHGIRRSYRMNEKLGLPQSLILYTVKKKETYKYFLVPDEKEIKERFSFQELDINLVLTDGGEGPTTQVLHYDYKKYFYNLLSSIERDGFEKVENRERMLHTRNNVVSAQNIKMVGGFKPPQIINKNSH